MWRMKFHVTQRHLRARWKSQVRSAPLTSVGALVFHFAGHAQPTSRYGGALTGTLGGNAPE